MPNLEDTAENRRCLTFHASIDHEFRHNIVKVAVDPRGDSRVEDYFDSVMTKFVINNRTDA